MTVSSRQRFSRDFPCLVCSGYDDLPRGRGMRCHGFLSDDGEWAMCTREEHAGDLERNEAAGTYAHRASGPCGCGKEHAPQAPISLPRAFKLWEFSETYDYQDENGALLFQVVRYPAPWKTFRQRQPLLLDAKPKRRTDWQWDLDGITPVLYRLPQLLAADPGEIVWYPEGEKDVDRLISLGLVATTNPMGAGKWRPHYAEWLKGRDIVLLEDNDAEGRRHGDVVERALVGMARSVKRLRFEDLPEGGDVSDWLDAGHTHEELIELVRPKPALQERVDAAVEEWKRGDVIKVKTLLLMAIPPARWAIDGLLPEGLTLFVGSVKVGKSFGAIGLTVAVTAGGRAFGQIPVQQGPALYLALEDNERRLQERYREVLLGSQAADELYVALEWPRVHEGGLPKLDSWLEEHPDTRLVVVDTLKKIRPPTGERKSVYDADYESLEGLQKIAAARHVAILVVHHVRKAAADDPVDRISGSSGLPAACDGIWVLERQRRTNEATLFVTHREAESQELALLWDQDLLNWILAGTAEDFRVTKERQAILDVLIGGGEPMAMRELADALEKNYNTVRNIVRKMRVDGLVEQVAGSKYRPGPEASTKPMPEGRAASGPRSATEVPKQADLIDDVFGDDPPALRDEDVLYDGEWIE
jgi:hypothetical protein